MSITHQAIVTFTALYGRSILVRRFLEENVLTGKSCGGLLPAYGELEFVLFLLVFLDQDLVAKFQPFPPDEIVIVRQFRPAAGAAIRFDS